MREAWLIFASHSHWMGWDLFLALVPLLVGAVLFRPGRRRGLLWWAGLCAFIAFLPNAPYVISDLVHLPGDIQAAPSTKAVLLGLLPLYGVFVLSGMEAYVLSLGLLRRYLRSIGKPRLVMFVNVGAPLAAGIGVFLGRVDRLNSWDPLLRPDRLWAAVRSLPAHAPLVLAVVAVIFAVGQVVWAADRLAFAAGKRVVSHGTGSTPGA